MCHMIQRYQNGEALPGSGSEDREQFLAALRSSIEIFLNRMRSNSQRGRSIANDSSVQTLFMTLTAMHPQLLQYIHEQEDQRGLHTDLSARFTMFNPLTPTVVIWIQHPVPDHVKPSFVILTSGHPYAQG